MQKWTHLTKGRSGATDLLCPNLSWLVARSTATDRRIEIWLEDKQETLMLLTNLLHLSAPTIAAVYI